VSKSPPSFCIEYGLLDLLRLMGIKLEYKCINEGFYPVGKGLVKVAIEPMKQEICPIKLI
jgi:RNA 3'-terminal phosphate cyclase